VTATEAAASVAGRAYPPSVYEVGSEKIREYARAVGEVSPFYFDPELGIDLALMVHGGQEFAWSEPVCAGDAITTTARVAEVYEKRGMGFFVFESVSENQEGREVVRGTWTNIVRRAPAP
jgi:acyl dehydratase